MNEFNRFLRRMFLKSDQKKILMTVIFLLAVVFATVATTLYLNGTTTISSNSADFDVRFTKAVDDYQDISSTAISSDGKNITYSTNELANKDDESVLYYTVTNNSSLYDAEVSVNCTSGENNDYYSVTNSLDSLIYAKSKKNGTITVKLLKNSDKEITEQFTCTLTSTAIERKVIGHEGINENVVSVKKYDETEGSSTYCVTGSESTCVEDSCMEDKTICSPGTIIDYAVNSSNTISFNVLKDEGDIVRLQSSSELFNSYWTSRLSEQQYRPIEGGPDLALSTLEERVSDWTNVNSFSYSIGDSTSSLGYSGCYDYKTCNDTPYSLSKSNVKARFVTVQELYEAAGYVNIGATGGRLPKWMLGNIYYTMTAGTSALEYGNYLNAIGIFTRGASRYYPDSAEAGTGCIDECNAGVITPDDNGHVTIPPFGIRPVIEIDK